MLYYHTVYISRLVLVLFESVRYYSIILHTVVLATVPGSRSRVSNVYSNSYVWYYYGIIIKIIYDDDDNYKYCTVRSEERREKNKNFSQTVMH